MPYKSLRFKILNKNMKVKVIIEKGNDGTYDACMEFRKDLDFSLLGQGKTAKGAIADFQ
jgi:hypothetical protein